MQIFLTDLCQNTGNGCLVLGMFWDSGSRTFLPCTAWHFVISATGTYSLVQYQDFASASSNADVTKLVNFTFIRHLLQLTVANFGDDWCWKYKRAPFAKATFSDLTPAIFTAIFKPCQVLPGGMCQWRGQIFLNGRGQVRGKVFFRGRGQRLVGLPCGQVYGAIAGFLFFLIYHYRIEISDSSVWLL